MILNNIQHYFISNKDPIEPYWKTHSHNDLSLVNLLFIKRSDVLDKHWGRILFYCCGMKDRVIIKTSVCHHSSGTHIASGTWWLVLWGRILEARWCLPMHEQPQVETNRRDLRTIKTSGSKDIYFCPWVGKRACSCEKEQIMIHKQPPNSTQKQHCGRGKA